MPSVVAPVVVLWSAYILYFLYLLLLRHNPCVNPSQRTQWLLERARTLGFDRCGVARVADLEESEELARLPEWLARGYAGEMMYLHDARRRWPSHVVPGARSIVVCALNYNTEHPFSTNTAHDPARGWVSRYAWGDDYHDVVGNKLNALVAAMNESFEERFEARAYVDTGPVLERAAARHAGLGWLGKNTCLINSELGSWLFLGVILTTLDLEASIAQTEAPPDDLCGNCTLCIEACPTGAIVEPYVLDARRCISYLTIELRGSIPEELRAPMGRHVFGCDICQDVCPHNRQAPATGDPAFQPRALSPAVGAEHAPPSDPDSLQHGRAQHVAPLQEQTLCNPSLEILASLDESEFRVLFRGSAIKRTKWHGLVRNACIGFGNSRLSPSDPSYPRIVSQLQRLAASDDTLIAEHARWALARWRA